MTGDLFTGEFLVPGDSQFSVDLVQHLVPYLFCAERVAGARIAGRAVVLAKAYAAHPERFPHGMPTPQRQPKEVWINKPNKTQPTDEEYMNLKDLKREWEEIAGQDAYWAVLSQRNRKFGKWDIQQFFRTGEQEIETLMKSANHLGYPLQRQIALDFGCGPGRLTRALSKHFRQCIGIDISEKMIDFARSLDTDLSNCSFFVNDQGNLQLFADNHFDLVYSNLVLQHLPSKATIYSYISDFVRIMKPNGLLVFQLPNSIPFEVWIQPRRTLYRILRLCGFSERLLYWKLGLHPMRMKAIPKRDVVFFLSSIGTKLLEVQTHNDPEFKVESSTYYSTK